MKLTIKELREELINHMQIHGDCQVAYNVLEAVKQSSCAGKSIHDRQIYYVDYFRMRSKMILTEPVFWHDVEHPNLAER